MLDDLAGLCKDKIENKDQHKERIQKVQSTLDELENVIKQKPQDETKLEEQLENAKALKPSPAAPPPVAPIPSLGATAPTASARIDAKKPTMGSLVDRHCGKEAWIGGKPKFDWTDLEDPSAVDFPQPTQMRSSSAKAQQPT